MGMKNLTTNGNLSYNLIYTWYNEEGANDNLS